MSRTHKTNARIQAEIMLRDYALHKKILSEVEDDALNGSPSRPEVPISGKNRPSDDTARRGMMLSTVQRRRMQEDVAAIDFADAMCIATKNGMKIRKIIDLVYREGTHTIYGAGLAVGINNPVWAGKLASKYFQWVGDYFVL
jgi:hypothetical protein